MQPQLGGGLPRLLIGNVLIEAFVRRCVRLGLYRASDPTLTQLIADDDNLFRDMLYNEHHVLKQLLPDVTNH